MQPVEGVLPPVEHRTTRYYEVKHFLELHVCSNYLIIDDDKSLNNLEDKSRFVLTDASRGFDVECLKEAQQKLKSLNSFDDGR